jgi:hypothetical protein
MTARDAEETRRWPRLYAAVLGALVVEVVLFYVLTRSFQ